MATHESHQSDDTALIKEPESPEKEPPEYVKERQVTLGEGSNLVTLDDEVEPVLSVVMPTLNEEDGIAECIRRIENALETIGIAGEIVVADSSTDRTPEIAREMGARVVVPEEDGYGAAYHCGFEHARGEFVAMGDADTTYDFEELPKLFDLVAGGEADMAMGSRLEGEILPGAMPSLHQYVGNPLLTRFLNFFYDAGVSDAHSGFRAFRAEMLDELDLQTTGMEFASEMIMAPARATSRLRRSRSSITNARGKRRSTVSATAGGTSGLCF